MARLAPLCLHSSAARSTAALAPLMTTWPGELMLAGSQTSPWNAVAGFIAGVAYRVEAEVEDGGHGSHAHRNGLLHVLAAIANGAHRVGKAEASRRRRARNIRPGSGRRQSWELSLPRQHAGGGDRNGKNGRLGDLGQLELFVRAFKAKLAELIAKSLVSLFEGAAGDGVMDGQFLAHAGGL